MDHQSIVQTLTKLQECPVPGHWTAARQHALKPVLLLALIAWFDNSEQAGEFVPFDGVLRGLYDEWWVEATRMRCQSANFDLAFIHLSDDRIWTLVDREQNPIESERPGHTGWQTISRVFGAVIHDSVLFQLRDHMSRSRLRAALVMSYFPPPSGAFTRLSQKMGYSDVATSLDSGSHTVEVDAAHEPPSSEDHIHGPPALTQQNKRVPLPNPARGLTLLPAICLDVLNVLDLNWRRFPLQDEPSGHSAIATKEVLPFVVLGDLVNSSPLDVLVLGAPLDGESVKAQGFWPTALERACVSVTDIIHTTLRNLLRQEIPLQTPPAEQARLGSASTSPSQSASALFAPVDQLIEFLWPFQPNWYQHDSAESGSRVSVARPNVAELTHSPLLSLRDRQRLGRLGCPLDRTHLQALGLSLRTQNALLRARVLNLADLCKHTPVDLYSFRHFGPKAYHEVVMRLQAYLAPWSSQLEEDLTESDSSCPPNILEEGKRSSTSGDTLDSFDEGKQDAHDERPLAAIARWFDGSPLPAILSVVGLNWRELRLGEVLGPRVVWTHDAFLLDESLCGFLQLAVITGSFARWSSMSERLLANDLRDGCIELILPRLLPASSIGGQIDQATSLPIPEAMCTVADLLWMLMGPGVASLRDREIEVFYVRRGLHDGSRPTLEGVGQRLNITRERVRQIEKRAQDKLSSKACEPYAQALGELARLATLAEGGATTVADAATRINAWISFGDVNPGAATRLFASFAPAVTVMANDVLIASPFTQDVFARIQDMIRQLVKDRPGITHDDIIAETLIAGGEDVVTSGSAFVTAVLSTMPDISPHGDDYAPVRGGLQARIVQAMRSLGRPAHFREIATAYRRVFPHEGDRSDNSIHAVFDRFPETFVLIGNGTFALAEQGYDPKINNVPSLVEHILEHSERPLHVEEVVEQGRQRYLWKANSLSAQLTTNPRIRPYGNGFFGLRDRDYTGFDPGAAYVEVFGEEKDLQERLVVGAYANARGHRVVQIKLSGFCLRGYIALVSRPLKELFPVEGSFLAEWVTTGHQATRAQIRRSSYALLGLGPLFEEVGAQTGDFLYIEQLATPTGETASPVYQLVFATPDDESAARKLIGLASNQAEAWDAGVLHYARDPERAAAFVPYSLAHPWTTENEANAILGYAPSSPYGPEYLQLAQAGGLVASCLVKGVAETAVIRPTSLGRLYAAPNTNPLPVGLRIALSFPAYRSHLRWLTNHRSAEGDTGENVQQLLGAAITRAWDAAYEMQRLDVARHMLEASPGLMSTAVLDTSAQTTLLLLLVAKSHGLSLDTDKLQMSNHTELRNALEHLRALGLDVHCSDTGKLVLAEPVDLSVASWDHAAARLREGGSVLHPALADAWLAVSSNMRPGQTALASDLYAELSASQADLLHPILVASPVNLSEPARFHDARLLSSSFTALVADWGLITREDEQPPFAFLSHADALSRQQSVPTVAVCLSKELLSQPWSAAAHLAGNAHLALLTLLAGDLGDLAEGIALKGSGWSYAGAPLLLRLDDLLRALGYDVWDDLYRDNSVVQSSLAEGLVALGVQLGLFEVSDGRLEAVGSLASAVYYSGYDTLGRVRQTLETAP